MARTHLFLVAAFTIASASAAVAEYPVAGVTPNQRPAGAPTITKFEKSDAWRKQYFRGVVAPYPASVVADERDQGGWYTPFNHPGMPGLYDIRGWHAK